MPPANYPTPPKKRTGKTPEAKVAAAIDRYLKKIGAVSLRTSAGLIDLGDRKVSLGATGTSDRTCCIAGRFVAIEIKAGDNKPTAAQQKYLDRVRAAGGIGFGAWSVDDVRSNLEAHFGAWQVMQWEKNNAKR